MRPDKIKNEDLPKYTGIEVEISEDGQTVTMRTSPYRAMSLLESEGNSLLRMAGSMLANGETKDAKGVAHMGACYGEQSRYIQLQAMRNEKKKAEAAG